MSMTSLTGVSSDADAPVGARAGGARRFGTAWLTLAVVVGLLLGFAAGLLAPRLARPGDTSPEAGFARDMSTHHAQAIEMAVLAHEKASDPNVRALAVDIALTQQAQVGMMQTWLREWKLDPTGSQPRMAWMPDGTAAVKDGLMPGMATDAQRAELRASTGRDFDRLFLRLMVQHHLGGVHMTEGVLELSDEPEVRRLAQAMLDGQRSEIQVMQLLAKPA